jgi:hypothetical protein
MASHGLSIRRRYQLVLSFYKAVLTEVIDVSAADILEASIDIAATMFVAKAVALRILLQAHI